MEEKLRQQNRGRQWENSRAEKSVQVWRSTRMRGGTKGLKGEGKGYDMLITKVHVKATLKKQLIQTKLFNADRHLVN